MDIEKDLKIIARVAREKNDENWEFRAFLKRHDYEIEKLDAIVHRITDEVCAQIDCTECGNCCKHVMPILDEDDISRFAVGIKISEDGLRKKYLLQDTDDATEYKFNTLPCPFLSGTRCSNYEYRPKSCASYPHLHKDEFVFRLWGVVQNYSCCPIVFNVYEKLKDELWRYDEFNEDDFYE